MGVVSSWLSFESSEKPSGGYALSTYAKYSEKLTFLTLWYAHVRVRIMGLEIIVFGKIYVHT